MLPNKDCQCDFQYDSQNYHTSSLLINIIFLKYFDCTVAYLWFLLLIIHTELWLVLGSCSEESL